MATAKELSKAGIRRKIIAFLDRTSGRVDPRPGKRSCGMIHKNALVLATSAKDTPRATVLEFYNEGLTLYIFGEPGGKIANIKRNPRVSAVIYEQPLDHSKLQTSLQIFGTAALISVRNNPKLFRSKAKKYNIAYVMKKLLSPLTQGQDLTDEALEKFYKKGFESLNIIKITPDHIILKEYCPDFSSKKYDWRNDGR
jgi:nitroimidazol reductase NimA-like FMN-containing flavoprotein (pyridoxamine 5'-phosphate oxidase superfamily)